MIDEIQLLTAKAQEAFAGGDLKGALSLFERAEATAREIGETDLADKVYCNAAYVRIEMGGAEDEISGLRMLFMRTGCDDNKWSAAYNLAVAFDICNDLDSALDWASRSAEIAAKVDDPKAAVRCNNIAGVLNLRRSRFAEAEARFADALECLQSPEGANEQTHHAAILGNLGYAMMCSDRLEEGLRCCETARRALEEVHGDHLLYENLQDLCYGYILDDQLERANDCGEKALALAEQYEDLQVMKNCLFLLSETAVRRGDTFRARRYLRELTNFYPEIDMNEEIIDVFLATDLTNVVNLRG
jgi:tetratricopeptide (TPR) repeat protein